MKHQLNQQQFKRKKLSIYVSVLMTSFGFTNATLSAIPNDLNIYKQPTQGQSTILLMLDSTANMDDNYDGTPRVASGNTPIGSILADYPECQGQTLKHVPANVLDIVYGKQATNNVAANSANSTFPPNPGIPYCGDSLTNTEKAYSISTITAAQKAALSQKVKNFKYSRMDRMKIAMSLLLSDNSITDKVSLGLGQFSTATPQSYKVNPNQASNTWISNGYISKWTVDNDPNNSHKDGNDISAKILIPNKILDNDQRFIMRAAVGVMGSGGRTPLASALAESGAYMLGNTTLNADGTSPGVSRERFWYDGGWKGIYSGTYSGGTLNAGPSSSNVTKGYAYSGFEDSATASKAANRYISPIPSSSASCNASGIFLLSNGIPTETPKSIAQALMKNALNDASFTCPSNNTGGLISATGATDYGWTCMGEFSKRLYNNTPQVKVAVAGFGNNFIPYLTNGMSKQIKGSNGKLRTYYKCNAITTGTYSFNGQTFKITESNLQDIKNSCNLGEMSISDNEVNTGGVVGGYGQGGFYPIVDASQLSDSIKNFVAELQTGIPSLNSGLPGIPIDPLNATLQLPFAYYSQFQPNTNSSQAVGIWLGNIKKFQVADNTFKDRNSNNVVNGTTGNLESTTDFWSTSPDGGNATAGGALSKLPVKAVVGRKIYTNRSVSGANESEMTLSGSQYSTALNLIDSNYTTAETGTAEALRQSTDVNQTNAYLLNLLGFGVTAPTVPSTLDNAPELRQMGATINSTPLMLTTKSKIVVKRTTKTENGITTTYNPGDYIDRKDYVLFGTNQGLIQVVDAETGQEKFAFLPFEMIQKQKKGFISKDLQTGSEYSDLYQGIDGAWSVYATYVADNESNSLKANHLNVYGGLRRGGSNYYGLDLKDIETGSPKMLFKVGPAEGGTCSNTTPLNCMGQSWSKPVTAWVKWKGKPQLVMIVGGGYDPVFDSPTYKANTDATKGNGVYIFAAESNDDTGLKAGDLMWWGSSSATTTNGGSNNDTQKTHHDQLKYSVVSEIKAVDSNSDSFIDHLYFGDLGGQVFRVDLNNANSSATKNFDVKRIVRIGNFIEDNERATKTAPRFYYKPNFTTHRVNQMAGIINATRYAVLSLGSGDQSSPTLNPLDASTGIPDRVYGIFDRDVGRTDLFTITDDSAETLGLVTGTATIVNMLDLASTHAETGPTLANMRKATTKGWFNTLTGTDFGDDDNLDSNVKDGVARYKVLTGFSAISDTLFTSYYDAADNGSSSSCSAGVKGKSFNKNYCLPFGNMNADGENCGTELNGRWYSGATTKGNAVGAGIVPVIVGGMKTSTTPSIGPITGMPNTGVNAQYKTPLRFEPLQWSEKNR